MELLQLFQEGFTAASNLTMQQPPIRMTQHGQSAARMVLDGEIDGRFGRYTLATHVAHDYVLFVITIEDAAQAPNLVLQRIGSSIVLTK